MRTGTVGRLTALSGDQGTFAHLQVLGREANAAEVALALVLGELPPRADAHNLSCLPPMLGEAPVTYLLKYEYSQAHGKSNYRFVGVLHADGSVGPMPGGRTAAELHPGNLMGDVLRGWAAQVEGCGCPGKEFATFPPGAPFHSFTQASPTQLVPITLPYAQKGVAESAVAVAALEAELAGEDLALTVSWV